MPKRKKSKCRSNKRAKRTNDNSKDNFDREEGRQLCKKYGIKANISNDNMKKCIQMVEKNIPISFQFKKITWAQKHASHILTGTIGLTLLVSGLFIYCRKQMF